MSLKILCLFIAIGVPSGFGLEKSAHGQQAMISAPTPEAVEAGLSVMKRGGNAIDAAAAAAFALMVTDPAMCSLGGRSQILIFLNDRSLAGIDGATQAPLRIDEPAQTGHGYRTIPVPGSPAALELMVESYGRLSIEEILESAIRLAEDGFIIKKDYHDAFRKYGETLRLYAGSRRHFFKPDGSAYSEGEVFKQPALASTLRIIARQGAGAMYSGPLSRIIVRDMKKHGGCIRRDDLARYTPLTGEIVEGSYRGLRVVSRGGNCDGASVVEMLHILEHFDVAGYDTDNPEYIHLMAQVLYMGFEDEHMPDWQQISKALAARRLREIDMNKALPVPVRPRRNPQGDTNHLSVIDAKGNAVSITQSIGPTFGSKVANPELGFLYAYSYDMNDAPIPYQREKTSQSPTMLFRKDRPFLVLGSAGSSRIPGSIVRTIVNVVDHGMTLENALASPRCFIRENELRLEAAGLRQSVFDALTAYGYRLNPYDALDGYFGRVHAVLYDPSGKFIIGASDPRDYGAAGGF